MRISLRLNAMRPNAGPDRRTLLLAAGAAPLLLRRQAIATPPRAPAMLTSAMLTFSDTCG